MDFKKQFCTREQSEKLIALGAKNEVKNGEFYYSCILSSGFEVSEFRKEGDPEPPLSYKPVKLFSVAELGEMIPVRIALPYKDTSGKWVDPNPDGTPGIGRYETEAEARATVLIRIKETELVK